MADESRFRVGLGEIFMGAMTLIMTLGIPWAYTIGTTVAEMSANLSAVTSQIANHIEQPLHNGAVAVERFDKLENKVQDIGDKVNRQGSDIIVIKDSVQRIEQAVNP